MCDGYGGINLVKTQDFATTAVFVQLDLWITSKEADVLRGLGWVYGCPTDESITEINTFLTILCYFIAAFHSLKIS